ncbi:MAG: M23 family metallopeptidase [Anaerolineae bacterium]|nr:M23 family metallopeptidase [Anaerolineae bacterium]
MRKLKCVSMFVLLALLLGAVVDSTLTSAESREIRWLVYTDPQYDFSVEYPATWQVSPRNVQPGYVGGSVSFSQTQPGRVSECGKPIYVKVEIGLYLEEREPSRSIVDWSEAYNTAGDIFAPGEVQIQDARQVKLSGLADREAFREAGVSPLTEFTYVNVPHGKTVWFIWMNSTDKEDMVFFDHIFDSLRFGSNTPTTLQEIYGQDYKSLSSRPTWEIKAVSHGLRSNQAPDAHIFSAARLLVPSNYQVPVGGPTRRYIACGNLNAPVCGGTHTGSAARAIDIGLPTGISVRNSARAYVNWVGWNTQGYGWLVMLQDTVHSYIAYYAHLSSINFANLSVQPIPQGLEIGLSGNSGGEALNPPVVYGPHLHFHVRTTGWAAVDLAGMPSLTLYSDPASSSYPNCGYTTCPGGFQCTCGRVY